MKTINILHLTDLHFGSSSDVPIGRMRNGALTASFAGEITGVDPRGRFIADTRRWTCNKQVDLIACTGDLGFRAQRESLKEGLDYLGKLAEDLGVSPGRVIVTPGNHDLDREADDNDELTEFCSSCRDRGFVYAKRTTPAVLDSFGPPIIGLNTCLGGREHAVQDGLPQEFWKSQREDLQKKERYFESKGWTKNVKPELEHQLKAMDIPAMGYDQLDKLVQALSQATGDCAIILMHHNPLPTTAIDIRPYANLIDSGLLLARLMDEGRRVIILHGHVHCGSGLSVFPHHDDKGGFVACVGSGGLSGDRTATATLVEVVLTRLNGFLRASVAYIQRSGDDYQLRHQYDLVNRSTDRPKIERAVLQDLQPNKLYTLGEVAEKLDRECTDDLAEELLQVGPNVIQILNMKAGKDNWRIRLQL